MGKVHQFHMQLKGRAAEKEQLIAQRAEVNEPAEVARLPARRCPRECFRAAPVGPGGVTASSTAAVVCYSDRA